MFAQQNQFNLWRQGGAVVRAALLGGALWLGVQVAGAAAITNVTVVNVTPTSFSVLWRAGDSTPSIAVFSDAGGATNLAGQLGLEAFPLNTGNPSLAAGYDRRQGQLALRQKTRSLGLMLMRVTGCRPNTAYYYRLTSTPSGSGAVVYPTSGPLPRVTTERENAFVVNAQQLIIDVPGVDNEGQVVTLSHPNATYPLATVVGDGVGANQAFFNVNDLFVQAGGGNFTPLGEQEFAVSALGPNQSETSGQFAVIFGTGFTVAQTTDASFGTEFLLTSLGSTIARGGQTSSVPVNFNSSVGVVSLNLTVAIPAGHLTNLALQGLSAEIDPATTTVTASGTNWLLHLAARSGQFIAGAKAVAQFAFGAISNRPSAFVPLKLVSIVATKSDSSPVNNLFAQSGRVVVVGNEPLLEVQSAAATGRQLWLYGKPWFSYAIQYSTNLSNPAGWRELRHFPTTNLVTSFAGLTESEGPVFYRALEFTPDPPVLDPLLGLDQSRSLQVYGKPGSTYSVLYATNMTPPVVWRTLLGYTLTNSFRTVATPGSNSVFYRLQK